MEKFGKIYRNSVAQLLKNNFNNSNSVFIIGYQGVDAARLGQLRQSLADINARLFVAKNSLAKLAVRDDTRNRLSQLIDGPTGFVFIRDQVVNTAKIIKEFIKENKQLIIRGGILEDKILGVKEIESLASLPSRGALLTALAINIKAPINNFVLTMNQLLLRFVVVLKAISDKKK